ncbi:hypothetical protein D3C84_815860 [compost metagenome]
MRSAGFPEDVLSGIKIIPKVISALRVPFVAEASAFNTGEDPIADTRTLLILICMSGLPGAGNE